MPVGRLLLVSCLLILIWHISDGRFSTDPGTKPKNDIQQYEKEEAPIVCGYILQSQEWQKRRCPRPGKPCVLAKTFIFQPSTGSQPKSHVIIMEVEACME